MIAREARDATLRLWQRFNAGREALGMRILKPSEVYLDAVNSLLAKHTEEDVASVIDHLIAEVRDRPEQRKWFNGTTPFRPKNFARVLGQVGVVSDRAGRFEPTED